MTVYEAQTLAALNSQALATWVASGVAAVALVVAVIGGIFAFRNLKLIADQLKIARLDALLSFEQDMAVRRGKFQEIAHLLAEPHDDESTDMLQKQYDEARESYFNALDRLASSILNGHFDDTEMRQDYREAIAGVVRAFQADFATGTHYRKVVKLYERWQDT